MQWAARTSRVEGPAEDERGFGEGDRGPGPELLAGEAGIATTGGAGSGLVGRAAGEARRRCSACAPEGGGSGSSPLRRGRVAAVACTPPFVLTYPPLIQRLACLLAMHKPNSPTKAVHDW